MKKRIASTILAVACTSSLIFSGCAITDSLSYANADKYTAGGGSVAGTVTEIEIDWIDGNVEIAYGDVTEVTFSETSKEALTTEYTLHYWLENTTLHIKCGENRKFISASNFPEKDLKVILPASLPLNKLDLEAVDTNVKIDHVTIGDVEIETVDGAVNAYLGGITREISVNTVEGDITVNADSIEEFDIETVGADVYLESVSAPRTGSFESVGGSFTLALYEGVEGFTVEVDGLGGNFESDFETTKQGDAYKHGNGACQYEAETVGGNVTVVKKTAK